MNRFGLQEQHIGLNLMLVTASRGVLTTHALHPQKNFCVRRAVAHDAAAVCHRFT